MKKYALILALMFSISACVTLGSNKITKVNFSKNFSKDNVNRVAIVKFGKSPGGFNDPINYDTSNITDKFTAELVSSDLFTIVDRKDIDQVMKEAGFQVTSTGIGTLDEATMEKLRQLGADAILTGKLVSFREQRVNNYTVFSEVHLISKLIKIETGEVLWSAEMSDNDRGKVGKSDATKAEVLLSKIIEKMSVSLKTENKLRRFIKF